MRERKFRGKNKKGEWLHGYLAKDTFKVAGVTFDSAVIFSNLECFFTDNFPFVVKKCSVEIDTIGQYTGLKDKNNKEIYEGDIVRIREYSNAFLSYFHSLKNEESNPFSIEECKGDLLKEYIAEIVFDEAEFDVKLGTSLMTVSALFGDQRLSQPLFEFEVIGNIYDNYDLLKYEYERD